MKNWYVATHDGQEGPQSEESLLAGLSSGKYSAATLIWREGLEVWEPIEKHFPEVIQETSTSLSRKKKTITPKVFFIAAAALLCSGGLLSLCVGNSPVEEPSSPQSAAASIMNDIRWYVGKEDWSRLLDTFQNSRNMEVVGKYYYHDGVERETPLELNDAQLHYRALYALWSNGQPSDVLSYGKLNDDIRDIEEKLRYAHSSETEQLQAALAQLQRTKSQRLMQYDVCRTKHLAAFLAGGDANGELAAGIEQVGKISKAYPGDETLAYYSRCLKDLRKSAELVSAAIPWECQLFIVDEYERDLSEMSEWLDLALYCSPQELVDLRNRIRRLIRQKMKEGTR